jgi:hypothetical protein
MGWCCEYGWKSADDVEATIYRPERLVAKARTREGGYLVSWALYKGDGDTRFIVCNLLDYRPANREWWHKDMDESMGPYYFSCPLSLLDGASEPVNESAREWRDNVRKWHAGKAQARVEKADWWRAGGKAYLVKSGPLYNGTPVTIISLRPLLVSLQNVGLPTKVSRIQLSGTPPENKTVVPPATVESPTLPPA